MINISLITIGNELLKGRIINTNASKAGEMLRNHGYTLSRVVTISDEKEARKSAVTQEMASHDVVLISGGLGPTKDDITKHTLAELFQTELEMHPPTVAFLEERYKKWGRPMTKLTALQALLPKACEVVENPKGTAPGMLFRQDGKMVFSMPGVPFEMFHMLEFGVLPRIKAEFPTDVFLHKILRLSDIPESVAAERMESIDTQFPDEISVAYLPRHDGLWIELSIIMPKSRTTEAELILDEYTALVAALFKDKLYARGDQPMAKELADLMLKKRLTLAVAESLTGGRVSAKIVEISGVSKFYKGSVTAYATEIKAKVLGVPWPIIHEHGVDSEPVARAMAEGVRKLLDADIGLATTGLAEADGDKRPHAWFGYADEYGSDAFHVDFLHDREVNIERAAYHAIRLGLKNIQARFE